MFVGFENLHIRTPKGLTAVDISFLKCQCVCAIHKQNGFQTMWCLSLWEPFHLSCYGNNQYCFNEKKNVFFFFPSWGIPVILLPAKAGKQKMLGRILALILCCTHVLFNGVTQTAGCSTILNWKEIINVKYLTQGKRYHWVAQFNPSCFQFVHNICFLHMFCVHNTLL